MKVSIITVCFNNVDTIQATIESVRSQNYHDTEYIVVDGRSSDGTLEVIESYSNFITSKVSEPDQGLYDAINKGIELATGDVVGLLHADDIFNSNHVISDVVNLFKTTACDAVYGDLQYVDRDDTNKIVRNWKAGVYKAGMFLKGWMPPHPTLYLRRDLFAQYGVYNTSFKISADYELMLRFIHKHKIQLNYLPQVLVKMRVGGKSNSSISSRVQANLEDRKAWKINGLKADLLTPYRKPLSKLGQFFGK